MLFVHEVHSVHGQAEEAFERLYRDGWMTSLAASDDARLLWYLHHTHGTGPAYTVVTVTGVADAAAWGRVCDRMHDGDLRRWASAVDGVRHDVAARILRPVPWSPVQSVDLADVPIDDADHDVVLFMEDTAWPHAGKLDDYLDQAGTQYRGQLDQGDAAGTSILRLRAAFQPAWGAGRLREIVLWQEVARPELLLPLFTREIPAEKKAPGTWMHDALELRDQWESRLLRCPAWSPLA